MRLLEGEVVQYRGVAYIVKGHQHPEGFPVAYLRYSLLTRTPLRHMTLSYTTEYKYWYCVKHRIPPVPLREVQLLSDKLEDRVLSAVRTLIYMLDISENHVYVTGSSLVLGDFNDVDVVLYGVNDSLVETLRSLLERGLPRRDNYLLIEEYTRRHSSSFTLHEYLALKKNTLLHLLWRPLRELETIRIKTWLSGLRGSHLRVQLLHGVSRDLEAAQPTHATSEIQREVSWWGSTSGVS